MKSVENSVVQIGAWRIDPSLDEISRDGETTKLEPRLMRLLLCLAAHAGQVVSVEQLLDEVWKDVVVTPDSVYHAVAALRRVLGDDSKDPSYIANVMRRGYRLIAPVVWLGSAEAPAPPLDPLRPAAEDAGAKPVLGTARSGSFGKPTGRQLAVTTIAVVGVALAYLAVDRLWIGKRPAGSQRAAPLISEAAPQATTTTPAAVFAPPPHSIAVLPFVNLSGDKEQEYFSDGLTEELLSSLARIDELQVAARASAFSFKGKDADVKAIAHTLNVGAVLEGSVRRSGRTIRITAQLDDAVTGFRLWSQTYDRDLGDVLKIQADIASAVAESLKVALLSGAAQRLELGETRNPAAFDAYLRGRKILASRHGQKDLDTAVVQYTEAIRLDAHYALAFVGRSEALQESVEYEGIDADKATRAASDAQKAVALAPELGVAHAVLSAMYAINLQFARMHKEMDRALELSPGSVEVLEGYASCSALIGQFERAIGSAHRAVLLDPLDRDSHSSLAFVFLAARRYEAANEAFREARTVDPDYFDQFSWEPSYMLGNLQDSRTWCEKNAATWVTELCLAVVYDKLGRRDDAEAQLAKMKASNPKADDWYQYAQIYAQWGQVSKALASLERAVGTPLNVGLATLKVDPLLDPLRQEPRFQAIEKQLEFPN